MFIKWAQPTSPKRRRVRGRVQDEPGLHESLKLRSSYAMFPLRGVTRLPICQTATSPWWAQRPVAVAFRSRQPQSVRVLPVRGGSALVQGLPRLRESCFIQEIRLRANGRMSLKRSPTDQSNGFIRNPIGKNNNRAQRGMGRDRRVPSGSKERPTRCDLRWLVFFPRCSTGRCAVSTLTQSMSSHYCLLLRPSRSASPGQEQFSTVFSSNLPAWPSPSSTTL